MHKKTLTKPDGRYLILYSRNPIPEGIEAPSPSATPTEANPHLRWHPLRGEWVAYASHRQNRTFLPPAEYSPLAVTKSKEFPTEMPAGDYDVAVFENLFPSLSRHSHGETSVYTEAKPALGQCEVVVFTQDPNTSLAELPVEKIDLLLQVWGDRTAELGKRDDIQYVMPFENRGVEMGVTLHHPHGQIYAYPFVPPTPARELEQQSAFYAKHGRGLIEDMIQNELKDGRRVLYKTGDLAAATGGSSSQMLSNEAISFVPVCARYTYETWVAPQKPAATLAELTAPQRRELARALKTTLMKFDRLWNRPFPYLMVLHQAPTDGKPHPEAHVHFQFYPPYRTSTRLKFLAGTELGAGMFANDSLPEEKAAELKQIEVTLE